MAYYVVINEQGPGWDPKRVMREQKGWTDHAKFMDTLEAERFVVLGGPLKYSKHRAMLIVNASDEQELRKKARRGSMDAHGCSSDPRDLSLGDSSRKAFLNDKNA